MAWAHAMGVDPVTVMGMVSLVAVAAATVVGVATVMVAAAVVAVTELVE